jgi:hypothetical protein
MTVIEGSTMAKRPGRPKKVTLPLAGRIHNAARAIRSERVDPSTLRRITEQAVRQAADPRLGTPLGQLYMRGILSPVQWAGGEHYARLVGQLFRIRGLRLPDGPGSPSFEIGYRTTGLDVFDDPDLSADERDALAILLADLERKIGRVDVLVAGGEYARLVEVHSPGMRRLSILRRVAVEQHYPSHWEIEGLRFALDVAAAQFGVAEARK